MLLEFCPKTTEEWPWGAVRGGGMDAGMEMGAALRDRPGAKGR